MPMDLANAADRVRPGAPGLGAAAPGTPGGVIKFTFTSAASALQTLRANPGSPLYISMKTTVACHICVGDSSIGAPTNTEFFLEPGDSWQDFMLMREDTSFRVKGDTAGGDLYILFSGH